MGCPATITMRRSTIMRRYSGSNAYRLPGIRLIRLEQRGHVGNRVISPWQKLRARDEAVHLPRIIFHRDRDAFRLEPRGVGRALGIERIDAGEDDKRRWQPLQARCE